MTNAREFRVDRQGLRPEHISRGTYLDYYKDLGYSDSKEGHDITIDNESAFQTSIKERRGVLATQQREIDNARSQLERSYKEKMAQSYQSQGSSEANAVWASASKIPVRVVNGDNIEQTYYLPQTAVDSIAESFNGDNTYTSAFVGGMLNIDAKVNSEARGKELHEELRSAANNYKNAVYENSYKQIAANNNAGMVATAAYRGSVGDQYSSANSSLSSSQAGLNNTLSKLEDAVATRKMEWATVRKQYQDRLSSMRELFNSLTIAEG